MKVAFISRSTLYESPGGDTVQMLKTAEYLKKLEVSVDIILSSDDVEYDNYDIIHFFNIIRPGDILKHFKPNNKNVISTIFVDYSEYEKKEGHGIRKFLASTLGPNNLEYLKAIARVILGKEKIQSINYLLKGHKSSIEYILNRSNYLLPNSISEYNRLCKSYNFSNSNFLPVTNGIEIDSLSSVEDDIKFKDSVICVGRIEGVKNQYRLIEAMNDLPYKCFIIGKPSINDHSYFKSCKEIAGDNIEFIDHLPQEKLFSIMKSAKVHVLPSWFETTGLVSLEAAYYDCNIVVTDKGDQKEYFKKDVFYCDPSNVDSIASAIKLAMESPVNSNLKERIKHQHTWRKAAQETYEVYCRVLSNGDSD